jgi:hypothetical protein
MSKKVKGSISLWKRENKMKNSEILISLLLVILCGCSNDKEHVNKTKSTTPVAHSGAYELADILAWAMPNQATNKIKSLPEFQDYNRFKGVISEIKVSPLGYEGGIVMLADGKQSLLENIEDDYKWKVYIKGPNLGADSIAFDSWRSIKTDIGPAYLRKHGFDLIMLSCFSEGDTPTNATALYLAQYPEKSPTLLSYLISTGSAGVSIEYQLHFGPIDWSLVPGARDINYAGEAQKSADCPYKEFN